MGAILFGDGSSGTLHITSGTTTISDFAFYTDLTIDVGCELATAGWPVYVLGTCTNNGKITANGGSGGAAVGNTIGAAGVATGSAAAFLGIAAAGHAGSALVSPAAGAASVGSSWPGLVAGATATNPNNAAGGNGAAGQGGGGGGCGTGTGTTSAGGTVTANIPPAQGSPHDFFVRIVGRGYGGNGATVSSVWGTGSGGGSGSANATTGRSGGSGAAGGLCIVRAALYTGSGTIEAKGGDAGASSFTPSAGQGVGGSGGGAGGIVVVVVGSGSTTPTAVVTGGAGAAGLGAGFAGGNGGNGLSYVNVL